MKKTLFVIFSFFILLAFGSNCVYINKAKIYDLEIGLSQNQTAIITITDTVSSLYDDFDYDYSSHYLQGYDYTYAESYEGNLDISVNQSSHEYAESALVTTTITITPQVTSGKYHAKASLTHNYSYLYSYTDDDGYEIYERRSGSSRNVVELIIAVENSTAGQTTVNFTID